MGSQSVVCYQLPRDSRVEILIETTTEIDIVQFHALQCAGNKTGKCHNGHAAWIGLCGRDSKHQA